MINMTHQPLVASYRKDLDWCFHLVTSLRLFSEGFLPPVVVVPSADERVFRQVLVTADPKVIIRTSDVPRQYQNYAWAPFMRAQIAMMSGDLHCTGDVVWLFGSDCFVTGALRPSDLMVSGRPVMPFSSYAELSTGHPACLVWRKGSTDALGWTPEHEFMRRLPLLYPRSLYPAVRRHVASGSDRLEDFEARVYQLGTHKNFSESNVMGAFAWKEMPDLYEWFLLDGSGYPIFQKMFPVNMIQFWSHGGLDRPCDQYHECHGKTPRSVMNEVYARWRAGVRRT